MNDKILKRARFKEALEQIEAALSGEDPSPICTQVSENGDGSAAKPEEEPTEAVVVPQEDAGTTKSEPAKTPVTTAKAARQTSAKETKAAQNKNNNTDVIPQPPAIKEEESVAVKSEAPEEDILTQSKVEDAQPEESLSPEVEVTSRSGRKIKPKK